VSHRDRFPVLAAMGVAFLLMGLAGALLGPIEIQAFYLFVEGGRFHYEGFRFGSFMFANIACQVLFYYLLAALFIPLGYGHLRARRWARTLALVLLWDWVVAGLPLSLVLLFMLFTAKALPVAGAVLVTVAVALCYPLVPLLLIRFYQSRDVRLTLETRDAGSSRLEGIPLPVLVLGSLYLFYALILHLPALANGLFPLFGVFLTGQAGFIAFDLAVLGALALAWGTFRQWAWAWWASLAYLGALALSVIATFARSSWLGILAQWGLPATELGWLEGVPLQGHHLAVLLGGPLVVTLGLTIRSRRHFVARRETVPDGNSR
jgi:hypothetical protein